MPTETTVFRLIWLLIAVFWVLCEIHLARKSGCGQETIQTFAENSEKTLWLTLIVAISLALVLKAQKLSPIPFSYTSRQLIGLSIFGAGIFLRYSAIKALGELFSTQLRVVSGHQLIRTGLYRRIRHPSYTGLLIGLTGMGIAMGDGLSLLVLWLLPLMALTKRITFEENLLLAQFGLDYQEYCQKTWKLLPWVY